MVQSIVLLLLLLGLHFPIGMNNGIDTSTLLLPTFLACNYPVVRTNQSLSLSLSLFANCTVEHARLTGPRKIATQIFTFVLSLHQFIEKDQTHQQSTTVTNNEL
jgi:hypothetical protein